MKKALGLDAAKGMYSGAAPISKDTLDYFSSLDMPVYEGESVNETITPSCIAPVCGGELSQTPLLVRWVCHRLWDERVRGRLRHVLQRGLADGLCGPPAARN